MTRTTFEGVRTTTRTVAMIQEARRLYGPGYPGIAQGGWNVGGVRASGGTHDCDAVDFKTRLMSAGNKKRWEVCCWRVGFAGWRRNLSRSWLPHFHCVPKGGDLSPAAQRQVADFHRGLDGLVSHARYPGIDASGYAQRTWEDYQAANAGPRAMHFTSNVASNGGPAVVYLAKLHRGQANSDSVKWLQRALNKSMGSRLGVDGDYGPKTADVVSLFQGQKCHDRADGKIGPKQAAFLFKLAGIRVDLR